MEAASSPEATMFRALALLPATSGTSRAKQLASLTALASTGTTPSLDERFVKTDAATLAVYLARSSGSTPVVVRFLDAIARRCSRTTTDPFLRASLAAAVKADRTFQLELACAGEANSPIGQFASSVVNESFRARNVPLGLVVDLVDAVEGDPPGSAIHSEAVSQLPFQQGNSRKPQYRMSEIDALFFEALDADSELLHRVWDTQADPPDVGRLRSWATDSAEPYHELMQTRLASGGGLATRLADAVATSDWAADAVLAADGLTGLRLLAETPPDEARGNERRLAFFRTEVARAIANVANDVTDIRMMARHAVDTGLVALLGEWALEPARAGGHLQAEAWRALHNLREGLLQPVSGGSIDVWADTSEDMPEFYGQVRFANGLLPLKPPGPVRDELVRRQVQFRRNANAGDVDVVFVHGLRGSPLLTWRTTSEKNGANMAGISRSKAGKGASGKCRQIWPRDWLAADAPFARVISARHDAGVLRGSGLGSEPTLAIRAERLRQALQAAGVGDGRDVVFVTHSYGGLMVKEALAGDPMLWKATRAVVFFATPHAGSPIAQRVPVFSRAVRELTVADAGLKELHDEFVGDVRRRGDVKVVSFGEELGYSAGRQPLGILVPVESADPGVGSFTIVEGADHVGVCKVGLREDFRYRSILDIVIGNC